MQFGAYAISWLGDVGDLVLLGHRYYSPFTGRFLTRDPIGYEGGVNVYAYTRNNPVMKADPSGLGPDDVYKMISSEPAEKTISEILAHSWEKVAANPVQTFAQGSATVSAAAATGTTLLSEGVAGTAIISVAAPVAVIAGGSFLAVEAYHHVGVPLAMAAFGPQTYAGSGPASNFSNLTAKWNGFQKATAGLFASSKDAAQVYGEVKGVLARVHSGAAHPYAQDGSVFKNKPPGGKTQSVLPVHPLGYYHEYTVPTPGSSNRALRRIVTGAGGEVYFTNDDYDSFRRLAM